ncbi:rRNA maturation RNase YbeY [Candidatus Termititenax aidoneus]|uniref:Endoribonuclease YbeY n=1 Tax=Termititenax aidoneus TaxID=2218524 RepID=A0A388TBJ3_TERA1|nr:rRNA maturation RNase YbeY [Candidatus Termititenax aidoneus]
MHYLNKLVKTPIDRAIVSDLLQKSGLSEISVTLCGKQTIRSLNQKFRRQNKATDVLSFDCGDIIICPAAAAANAKKYRNTLANELLYLLIHGICHLQGHDHGAPRETARMQKAEQRYLAYLRKKYKILIMGRI